MNKVPIIARTIGLAAIESIMSVSTIITAIIQYKISFECLNIHSIQHYVIMFVSDLWQIGGFLQ
jgi:hypothetical protein